MKIKRILTITALMITALLMVFGATSCNLLHEHIFSEWETVSAPTCTSFGLSKRVCECGYAEYEPEAATAHEPVTDAAVDSTCTAVGKTEGSHCGVCGAVITAQKDVATVSHTFSEWETVSAPTCTSIGLV